jgi:hypothetical protein
MTSAALSAHATSDLSGASPLSVILLCFPVDRTTQNITEKLTLSLQDMDQLFKESAT